MKKSLSASTPTSPSSSSSSSTSSSNVSLFQLGSKPKTKRTSRRVSNLEKTQQSSNGNGRRSSMYRGVTRHRWTGRYEAHLWDKSSWNPIQNKKGKQVYLGAYDDEQAAAHTYDLAALKYWGPETILNFPLATYAKEYMEMQTMSREEYLASLRRRSSGFSRGVSKYRGVARHHHNGRWEARIGRVLGNKYLYLGTFSTISILLLLLFLLLLISTVKSVQLDCATIALLVHVHRLMHACSETSRTQEEAAHAYDLAAIEYRGMSAVTNFDINCYLKCPQQQQQQVIMQDVKPLPLPPRPATPPPLPMPTPMPPFYVEPLCMAPTHSTITSDIPLGEHPWSLGMEYTDFAPYYNISNMEMAINEKSSDLHGLFMTDSGFEDNIEHLFEETNHFGSIGIGNEANASCVMSGGLGDGLNGAGGLMEAEDTDPSSPTINSASYNLPINIYS